jgi:hypothetical protein
MENKNQVLQFTVDETKSIISTIKAKVVEGDKDSMLNAIEELRDMRKNYSRMQQDDLYRRYSAAIVQVRHKLEKIGVFLNPPKTKSKKKDQKPVSKKTLFDIYEDMFKRGEISEERFRHYIRNIEVPQDLDLSENLTEKVKQDAKEEEIEDMYESEGEIVEPDNVDSLDDSELDNEVVEIMAQIKEERENGNKRVMSWQEFRAEHKGQSLKQIQNGWKLYKQENDI